MQFAATSLRVFDKVGIDRARRFDIFLYGAVRPQQSATIERPMATDIQQQERMWETFTQLTKWSVILIAIGLIILALALI